MSVAAQPRSGQSLQDGRTDGGGAEALLLSAPESMQSSLKFTARLHAEDTWQALARASSPPHTTSQPRGPEKQDTPPGWTQTFLSVCQRCRCWAGKPAGTRRVARMEVSPGLPCVFPLPNRSVRAPQISTWSPNWAPPFLPRN